MLVATLVPFYHPVASSYAPQHLTKLLSKPVGSKAKTCWRSREDISADLCHYFNVKFPQTFDKTATSTLINGS